MIRDFKAQIFCRETNLSKREIDTADPIWIDRIDAFFRQTPLLPPDGDPTEYAKAFEAVYPEARHRRQYIDDAISNLPKRMVIHKTTAFKEPEIEGAFDALAGVAEIECVEVSSASCWRGVWLIKSGVEKPPSRPSGFPVPRGTMVVRTGNSVLVWVAGNAPEVSNKGDYYQGKKSIPRPLQLIRHAGSGPLELTAHEALALTKMDWNNDALYDPVPVSIRYSQKLARTIANVPDLPRNVYPYRLFM